MLLQKLQGTYNSQKKKKTEERKKTMVGGLTPPGFHREDADCDIGTRTATQVEGQSGEPGETQEEEREPIGRKDSL